MAIPKISPVNTAIVLLSSSLITRYWIRKMNINGQNYIERRHHIDPCPLDFVNAHNHIVNPAMLLGHEKDELAVVAGVPQLKITIE